MAAPDISCSLTNDFGNLLCVVFDDVTVDTWPHHGKLPVDYIFFQRFLSSPEGCINETSQMKQRLYKVPQRIVPLSHLKSGSSQTYAISGEHVQ